MSDDSLVFDWRIGEDFQWILELILAFYNGRCAYCDVPLLERSLDPEDTSPIDDRTRMLTWDHVIPASRGGSWAPHNLVPACLMCNSRKGADVWPLATKHPWMTTQDVLTAPRVVSENERRDRRSDEARRKRNRRLAPRAFVLVMLARAVQSPWPPHRVCSLRHLTGPRHGRQFTARVQALLVLIHEGLIVRARTSWGGQGYTAARMTDD